MKRFFFNFFLFYSFFFFSFLFFFFFFFRLSIKCKSWLHECLLNNDRQEIERIAMFYFSFFIPYFFFLFFFFFWVHTVLFKSCVIVCLLLIHKRLNIKSAFPHPTKPEMKRLLVNWPNLCEIKLRSHWVKYTKMTRSDKHTTLFVPVRFFVLVFFFYCFCFCFFFVFSLFFWVGISILCFLEDKVDGVLMFPATD